MANYSSSVPSSTALGINKVLRNTYLLLSMTLIFSALTAGLSMMANVSFAVSMGCSFGAMALIWLVLPRVAQSSAGIGVVFAITGLLGFGLGPMLNAYLQLGNGAEIIATALGGTGVIFLALSGYVLTTRRDFSFMGGFLIVGLVIAVVAMLANLFLAIPALSLAISAAIILIMSGLILFDTSRIIHGGETNYIMATVSLYLSLYNIFVNLLAILGMSSDD
ncbi:MAG: Bax inhibitor-1/YccA family protein [Gammaproteobacteria bacterium]|jgi:modulator of FtsH protease|nr:Bax inhibitor-1/YccA family protein [Gammaproteobacteria bacterium]